MRGTSLAGRIAPAVTLLVAVLAHDALAQSCCSPATTPSAAIERQALPAGRFVAGLYFEHYALEGGRRGTEDFTYPNDRRTNAQTLTLGVSGGVLPRLALAALATLVRRERSDLTLDGDRFAREHAGFSDLALLGYVSVLPRPGPREWTIGAGIKLATGEARAEDETGELPEELQPGTGANDFLLTSAYAQALGTDWTASAGVTWRATGTLTKIDEIVAPGGITNEVVREYEFGSELLYGAALAWSPDGRIGFGVGLRGRHAEPDRGSKLNPDGTVGAVVELPSTGGERIWLAPGVRIAGPRGGAIAVSALVPIYENLYGSQLSSKVGVRASVEAAF